MRTLYSKSLAPMTLGALMALALVGCASTKPEPAQSVSILEPTDNATVGTTFKVFLPAVKSEASGNWRPERDSK